MLHCTAAAMIGLLEMETEGRNSEWQGKEKEDK